MKATSARTSESFSARTSDRVFATRSASRATASATIEPMGEREVGVARRQHQVKIVVELEQDARPAGKAEVTATTRRALASFAPRAGETDRRECRELASGRRGKNGVVAQVVVAIEGTAVCAARPSAASIDSLSESLLGEGYHVVVRERRECAQRTCASEVMVPWNHHDEIPAGWSTAAICGNHRHKTCTTCQSVYLCTSVNSAGQAPSVYCQVCNAILMEWGSSKVWEAELVTRGVGAVAARSRRLQRSA